METADTFTPFGRIGMAFSGGGFRAAAFSLGTLSYLDAIRDNGGNTLLSKVTFIGSASGGSITTALFALSVARQQSFRAFYNALLKHLEGTDLLNRAVTMLNDDKEWTARPQKQRNIINAFALAYDRCLFDKAVLGDLRNGRPDSRLEEICLNATEFYTGLLFRQNIKIKTDIRGRKDVKFRYGNFSVHIEPDTAARFRLSDLLAASSCFPAGFEPVLFPDDFAHEGAPEKKVPPLGKNELLKAVRVKLVAHDLPELKRLYSPSFVKQVLSQLQPPVMIRQIDDKCAGQPVRDSFCIGLMDGGITDNQAVDSILDAQHRRQSPNTAFAPFDLMFVSDVGSHFMDPYTPEEAPRQYTGWKGITIRNILWLCVIGILGCLALAVIGFATIHRCNAASLLIIAGILLLPVFSCIAGGLLLIKKYISGNIHNIGGLNLDRNFSGDIVRNLFSRFGKTPVMVLFHMIRERISSVVVLNNDIFLKRIRYLLFNFAYEDKKYAGRLKANHIYDLAYTNDYRRSRIPYLAPNGNLQKIAQFAFEMATTLWFDAKDTKHKRLEAIVAAGQFTTCYNLLEYIHRLLSGDADKGNAGDKKLNEAQIEYLQDLKTNLLKDYERFKEDPFWLFNQLGARDVKANQYKFPKKFNGLR